MADLSKDMKQIQSVIELISSRFLQQNEYVRLLVMLLFGLFTPV
jgi:hypothetical protein